MAKILKQIWFDVIEPPDRSFVWVRPEGDTVYNTYIYGNSGWSLIATNNNVVSITPEEFDAITDIDTSAFYVVKGEESPTADLYFGGTKIGLGDSLVVDDVPTEGSDNLISSGAVFTSLESKQNNLVSGVNIKTINDSSILGNGNIGVQEPLISGVTIKTINGISVLGTGNVAVQPMLSFDSAPVSQSNNPVTSDGIYNALTGKQATLVSGTNIKTVKNTSLLGSGNIDVEDGKSAYELWLEAGNAGTEADFFASLQGDSGYSGAAGELQVVNNLTAGGTTAALSAEQGKLLKNITDSLYSRPVVLSESAYKALATKDSTKIYMTYEDE